MASDKEEYRAVNSLNVESLRDSSSGRRRRSRRGRPRTRAGKIWRQVKKIVTWQRVLMTVLAISLVVVVGGLILVTDARNQVNASWDSLSRVLNSVNRREGAELTLQDFDRLQTSVNDLSRRLNTVRSRAGIISPVAGVNPDLRASIDLLNIGFDLSRAADNMLSGLQPTLFFMFDGENEETVTTRISSGGRIVELLEVGFGRFLSASQNLTSAKNRLDNINLSGISPELLLTIDEVNGFYNQLADINAILLDSPDLLTVALGLDQDRTYLILSQNSDEIRPSGGYISTYGWMDVRNGRIVNYNYSATTATSPVPPEPEFIDQFNIPSWWLRYRDPIYAAWDGSWHADFPATADMARQYYDAGNNPSAPVDGVIAIDLQGFETVLEALGQVRIPEYNVIVTPENFRDVVYDIRAFGEGQDPHKRFVAAVYQEIFNSWQNIDQERSAELLGSLLQAMQSKHIMFYFVEENLNDAMNTLGWSGQQLPATNHDYLLVADANLGNKANNSILRQLTYDVTIQPDETLNNRLTVDYEYFDSIASEDPAIDPEFHGPLNYNNLLQVFAADGSELVSSNVPETVTSVDEETHTVFVTRVGVEYDTAERFQFVYDAPDMIEEIGAYKRYRLLVQKQPGTRTESVNIQVILPETARVVSTNPEATAVYELDNPTLYFQVELDRDQWLEVTYTD